MTKIRIYGQIIIEFLPRAKKNVVGRDFALDAIESGNVFKGNSSTFNMGFWTEIAIL